MAKKMVNDVNERVSETFGGWGGKERVKRIIKLNNQKSKGIR